jgi:hypothetical protein
MPSVLNEEYCLIECRHCGSSFAGLFFFSQLLYFSNGIKGFCLSTLLPHSSKRLSGRMSFNCSTLSVLPKLAPPKRVLGNFANVWQVHVSPATSNSIFFFLDIRHTCVFPVVVAAATICLRHKSFRISIRGEEYVERPSVMFGKSVSTSLLIRTEGLLNWRAILCDLMI